MDSRPQSIATKHRTLSPDESEKLKPIVKEYYIDKGWNYLQMAKYLQDNHNWEPTKNQFKKRVTVWGLEKNKRNPSKKHSASSRHASSIANSFETNRKLAFNNAHALPIRQSSVFPEQNNHRQDIHSDSCNSMSQGLTNAYHSRTCVSVPQAPITSTSENDSGVSNIPDFMIFESSGGTDVNCLDESEDVEEVVRTFVADTGYTTSMDILVDLPNGDHQLQAFEDEIRGARSSYLDVISQLPWNSPTRNYQTLKKRPRISLENARAMESSLMLNVSALQRLAPSRLIDVVEKMHQVADRYFYAQMYVEAEQWYRRIVTAKRNIIRLHGHESTETLGACMKVIKSVFMQERDAEAQDLHRDFNLRLQHLLPAEHELSIESKNQWCDVLHVYRSSKEEESQRREILQTCIFTRGFKHQTTIRTLRDLGYCLLQRKVFAESERIIRATLAGLCQNETIHLHQWTSDSKSAWDLSLGLASTLRTQERYSEAVDVLSNIKQRYEGLLKESWRQFKFDLEMALLLFDVRQFEASERLLRKMLEQQDQTIAVDQSNIEIAQSLLGGSLSQQNKPQEAIIWYEKCSTSARNRHGVLHPDILNFCWNKMLGYTSQKLWDEAFATITQTTDAIAAAPSRYPENDAFKAEAKVELQGYMAKVEGWRDRDLEALMEDEEDCDSNATMEDE